MWQVVRAGCGCACGRWCIEVGSQAGASSHNHPHRALHPAPPASLMSHARMLPLSPQAAAELLLSPDGRFLYASNRGSQGGHNSIAVFGVCPSSGRLAPLAWETGGGAVDFPRHMSLAAGGSLMLVRLGLGLGGRQGTGLADGGGFGFGLGGQEGTGHRRAGRGEEG